ncbi:hypothetical protein Fmac_008473 [Flemingia macrophylla]|uniref:Leucine-rich repeat-containing N-terminal plant-type domain-containing protein n=1 Tax=Flemingia macrophylla TaxID=520843 RepID=A0ABD1MYP4_9FABA
MNLALAFALDRYTNCFLFVPPTKCHKLESYALLKFKERFVISKSASYDPFSYPKIASWNGSTDCCSWDGIQCDLHTGHVIAILLHSTQIYGTIDANSSLFHLKYLQTLDLADNDFNHSQIPSRIGELSQLRHLNLSEANFCGEIPQEISHLSKLLTLDLCSTFYISLNVDNILSLKISTLGRIIQNSTNLEILNLDYVTISSSVPRILTNLTSLQRLSLYYCELYGEFPTGVFHLPNLRYLNLGNNRNITGRFPDFNSNAQITILEISFTSFYGTLPSSIGNLKSLNWLSISQCNFSGPIPSSFGNLTQLTLLDIGNNKLKGHFPSFLENLSKLHTLRVGFNEFTTDTISWICKLSRIDDLEIDFINIGGQAPLCFANLTQLSVLSMSHCNLIGQFPSFLMNLTDLDYINLAFNHLQGSILNYFFKLEKLKHFNVAHNLLRGELELDKFLMLRRLVFLELSYNKLSLISGKNPSNVSLSRIQVLGLHSCNLNEFPHIIQNMIGLSHLYMSDNNVTSFPSWMCGRKGNLKSLVHLDLSFNSLSDMVPSCLGSSISSLQNLVLKGNKLIGPIPQTYLIKSALRVIDVSYNNLEGQLPRSLVNCRMLEFIDVSHNQIIDSFPCWLGTLFELKVIALSDNHLYGSIRCPTTCTFPKLQIIDLSHNQFSGNLPSKTIQNWKSMKASTNIQLQYESFENYNKFSGRISWWSDGCSSCTFTNFNKGMTMVCENVDLQLELHNMIVIDLSSNKFCGEIPDVVGDLTGLVWLNLSNNRLCGGIPSSLGNLPHIEALDLSLNSLSGKIPQQLVSLTFLSYFNVCFNQELCGNPLSKKCEHDEGSPLVPHPVSGDDKHSGLFEEFVWKVILIGYGCGFIAGVALGRTFGQEAIECLKRLI